MVLLIWIRTAACAVVATEVDVEIGPFSDEFIHLINYKQDACPGVLLIVTLKDTPYSFFKKLTGAVKSSTDHNLPRVEHSDDVIANLPKNFDPREKWPGCPSLNEVRDQGACGSCWAFGAVEAMTDRICIYSNGSKQLHISAEDLLSCCEDCGNCHEGYPREAWEYWQEKGIVTGGNFNSSQGCRPYSFPLCEHDVTGELPPCIKNNGYTPVCSQVCEPGYKVQYENDKQRGKRIYSVHGEKNIMPELYTNGPVEAIFDAYTDLACYKSGVYIHTTGLYVGGHAVKMMGWGVENGEKYWLITNSWKEGWGDKGFFKILRGKNHCNIEESVWAGEPL